MADLILGDRFGDAQSDGNGRTAAWHRKGSLILPEDQRSMVRVGEKVGLIYKVEKLPLFVLDPATEQYERVPGQFILRREKLDEDNNFRYFETVTDAYSVLDTRELLTALDPLAEKWPVQTAGVLANGERVFMLMSIGQHAVAGIDPVDRYFLLLENKNGRGGIRVMSTTVRVVCQNTLDMALKAGSLANITLQHTQNATQHTIWAAQILAQLEQADAETISILDTLAAKKLKKGDFDKMLKVIFPAPKKNEAKHALAAAHPDDKTLVASVKRFEQRTAERELWGKQTTELFAKFNDEFPTFANTAWAAINSVTEWCDHTFSREGKSDADACLVGGYRGEKKSDALNFLLNLN